MGWLLCFCSALHWVHCHHLQLQTFAHSITSEQLVRFFHLLRAWWHWTLGYLIRLWWTFVVTLTLNLQGHILNLLYLSQKWSDCHEMKYQCIIEHYASHVTIGFNLGQDLQLEFSRSDMEFATSKPKNCLIAPKQKQTYQLNFRPQMWPMGLILAMNLTLKFQIWNLLYLITKLSNCHKT